MVNYQEAFEKPFTDIKKLALGILLSVFPIINWFAKGFILECSGVGDTKPGKKMPEWKNFLGLFVKGFMSFFITFIYLIPAAVVLLLSAGPVFYKIFSSLTLEQLQSTQSATLISAAIQSNSTLILSVMPFIVTASILAILAIYITPTAVLSYLSENKLSAAFKIKKVLSKSFSWAYLFVWLLVIIIWMILGLFGYIPYIGDAIASFISGVIAYSLFGQVFLKLDRKY